MANIATSPEQIVQSTKNSKGFPIIPGIEELIQKVQRWKIRENYSEEVAQRSTDLWKLLYNLPPDKAEQVAILYLYFYFRNNTSTENPFSEASTKISGRSNSIGLPFGLKPGPNGKGGSFNPIEFPIDLQALLQIYVKLVNP